MDSLEDVDKVLAEIERKYNKNAKKEADDYMKSEMNALSEEFETLGLPATTESLPQFFSHAHVLIEMYRKTLTEVSDLQIESRCKDNRSKNLEKTVGELKSKLNHAQDKHNKLENSLLNSARECIDLKKIISTHSSETEKIKRYYKSKHDEQVHQINNLRNENERLKEICGKEFGSYISTDTKYLKAIKKYKENESVMKDSIEKLKTNNAKIVEELLTLREELATAYLND